MPDVHGFTESGTRRVVAAVRGFEQMAGTRGGSVADPGPAETSSVIPVSLSTDGGSAGSETAACNFTYTADTLTGEELGTGLVPKNARPPKGEQTAADFGLAYYDENGDIQLSWVNEGWAMVSTCT